MSRITTCSHCSTRLSVAEGITDKTLICPRCLADVDNARPGSQIRAADINTDVKRDLSAGSIVLLVLIGLSVLGIAMAFFIPASNFESAMGKISFLMLCFFALDVLVSIAIVRGLIRWGTSGIRAPSVGRVFGIMFLSLGTIVAVIIFFFFTCLVILKFG
ncbi:MAG: hypothetical protein ACYC3I_19020 [Gemmataceae bacterium]